MTGPTIVDLRSDTITRPPDAMRAAMLDAPVGDDVYGEDPTVGELERRVAMALGHEAGLFCATGSLANVIGVRLLVEPGQEVICDVSAHIARAEMGAHAALHGLTMRTFGSEGGLLDPEQVSAVIAPDAGPYLVSTAAVAVENTHNFGGGVVQPLERLAKVAALCREHGVGYHLDGARLWNAHVASGVSLVDYGQLFDTVSVCFSKGLGAPVGSVLVGSAEQMVRARALRKRLGAGWRQAGMLAAAALYALDHQVERLAEDHHAARLFASAVAARHPGAADPASVQTNIVVVDTGGRTAIEVTRSAAARGVLLSPVGRHRVRAVTHLDVTSEQCGAAGAVLADVLTETVSG
ncbi:MAG TPA: GntG family PLP-dependent aldolase [Propionibacteriaceae bacterium]|nr:GntG family PLP-dependent aldolase [Propionibacteriaceae bacterium]